MSTSIEQRVVEMRFDNRQFERGIAQSMATLDQFNQKLNFKGAGKGLQEISKAAEQVSLVPIIDQTNLVGEKFNAMTIVAITALQRLTNAAITAGTNMVKSLSVDQVTSGWNKYVEKTASVQTIMNATGKSVEDVNKYLDKLMWFSDETSYSFNDMTAAMGQMTATGGDIEKIVPLLYGVANATAYAGKGAAEFSRVMYNLNQSYGQGYLSLMDWRSVQNAGVASKQLTEELIRAGEELGRIQKGTVTIGNFTDKLKDKWADTEVMEVAFGRFGEMSLKAYEMVESGMVDTASEAYAILSETYDGFGLVAAKAAQEAKSFGEAVEATKDAVSSGWMKTFEIIFGNYEEAKILWTDLANTMWEVFASGADSRNEMLQYWKDIGGRKQAIEAVTAAYKALASVLGTVKDAVSDILFPGTAKEKGFWLYNATLAVRDFAKSLSLSDEALSTLRISFKALLLPVQAFVQVVRVGMAATGALIQIAVMLIDRLLSLPHHLSDVAKHLRSIFGDDRYNRIAESLSTIVGKLGDGFAKFSEKARELFGSFEGIKGLNLKDVFQKLAVTLELFGGWLLDRIVDGFEALSKFDFSLIGKGASIGFSMIVQGAKNLVEALKSGRDSVGQFLSQFEIASPIDILKGIAGVIVSLGKGVVGFFKDLGLGDAIGWLIDKFGAFAEILGRIGSAVVDFTNKLTPARILVFGFGTAIVAMLFTISSAISKFAGVAESLSGVFTSTSGLINALTDRVKPNEFKEISVAILILAGALAILSQINPDRLWGAVGAVGALMAMIAAMIALLSLIEKFLLTTPEMIKGLREIGVAMLMMTGSIAVLSAALLILSKIDMTDMGSKFGILVGAMGALVVGIRLLGVETRHTIGDALFILSFALAMKTIIEVLAELSEYHIKFSIESVGSMIVVVGLLSILARSMTGINFTTGLGALALVGSLLIFAQALKKLAKINPAILVTALINFIPIFGILGIIANAVVDTKGVMEIGVGLVAIAGSLLILYKAIEMIGNIDDGVLKKGASAVGALMIVFGLMQRIAGTSQDGNVKMQGSFIAMAASILLLSVAIDYIGSLELGKVIQGTVVVSALLLFLTELAEALGPAKKSTGAVVAMTFAIGLLVAAVAILTLLDPKELLVSVTGLGVALVSLGKMFELIGKGNVKLGQAFKFILTMIPVLMTLSFVFKYLNDLNPEATFVNAVGIGIVLVALAESMNRFRVTTGKLGNIGKSLLAIAGMLSMAVASLYILSGIPNSEGLLVKVIALGAILTELGILSFALSKMTFKKTSLDGIVPVLGALTVILGISGVAVALLNMFEINDGLFDKIGAVSILMTEITGLTVLVSKIKMDPVTATQGALAIDAVGLVIEAGVVLMGLIAAGIGELFTQFPRLEDDLDKGIVIFGKIGSLFGAIIGGFAGGIAEGFTGALPAVGENMSIFMEKLTPFIDGLGNINEGKVSAISSLGDMMMALTRADLLNNLRGAEADDILETFADSLVEFGQTFVKFADEIDGIDEGKVTAVGYAMKTLAELMSSVPFEGGLIDFFIGHQDVEKFGKGIQKFADGFKTYAETISSASLSKETVDKTKYATESLVELANTVPYSGGVLQNFLGEQNLGVFGRQLQQFAEGLVGFFRIIAGEDLSVGKVSIDYSLVTTCANASKALADFASSVPTSGGQLQTFFGSQNVGTFGTQIQQFARGLVGFFRIISGEDSEAGAITIDQDVVNACVRAGEAFAGLANQLPNTGGYWQAFVGSVSLSEFGDDISDFGEGLYHFFQYFKDAAITDTDVVTAKNAGEAFSGLINNLKPNSGAVTFFESVDLSKYGEQLEDLGKGMWGFFYQIEDVDWGQVSSAVSSIRQIASLSSDMEDMNPNSAISFKSYLNALAESSIDQFADSFGDGVEDIQLVIGDTLKAAFDAVSDNPDSLALDFSVVVDRIVESITNEEYRIVEKASALADVILTSFADEGDKFVQCGKLTISGMIAGMSGTSEMGLKEKVRSISTMILDNVESILGISAESSTRFENIGRYCILGFIRGFSSEASSSYQQIRTVAESLAEETERTLGVASPSVRFTKIGMYCMLGLEKGIDDYAKNPVQSAVKMGEKLLGSIKGFFGIRSPSTVTRDEVGRYIVDGIAEGITNNMSAEEAATKKAQNIVSAFQKELSKFEVSLKTKDLEFQLWQAMNPNASEADSNIRQMELLDAKLKAQAEYVNAANAQYQATLKALGANANETQERYNDYLQQQIEMANLANQMIEMQGGGQGQNRIGLTEDDVREPIQLAGEIFANIKDDMLDQGFTLEEIRKASADLAGWVPRTADAQLGGVQDVVNKYMTEASGTIDGISGNVEVSIVNSVRSGMTTSASVAREGGATIAQETAAGISDNGSLITNALNGTFNINDGIEAGKNFISGLENGLNDASVGTISIGSKWVQKISEAPDLVKKVLGEHSPSVYTYEAGVYFIQGLANGLADPAVNKAVVIAASNAPSNALNSIQGFVPKFTQVGTAMMQGLMSGITSMASSVVSAATTVVQNTLSATKSFLGIHSPSKEYYQVGEYMDQGLANGILDNASIVTNAISDVLGKAQDVINSNELYVTPVTNFDDRIWEPGGLSGHSRISLNHSGEDIQKLLDSVDAKLEQFDFFLQWDPSTNELVAAGEDYRGGAWMVAHNQSIVDAVRSGTEGVLEAMMREEAFDPAKNAKMAYQGIEKDLNSLSIGAGKLIDNAVRQLELQQKYGVGTTINYNQTINSPKNVNAADVYRASNTVVSQIENRTDGGTKETSKVGTQATFMSSKYWEG